MPLKIIVELHNSKSYEALLIERDKLQEQLSELKQKYSRLENSYAEEVYMNSELIDILKLHHIDFRKALDHKNR